MSIELPQGALRGDGIELSAWIPDPEAPYASMRHIMGTDPSVIANRVAFIEKTPRVRVRAFTNDHDDFRGWHAGYKGSDGWDEVSQGWCDAQLIALGYQVSDPQPFDAASY